MEKEIKKQVEFLLFGLNSLQWKALSEIRNQHSIVSLSDKRKLLNSIIIER